jgi:hypothetical protein
MLKESIRPRYATEPEKISRAIITGREMDARAFEAAKKSLRREFPNRFNNRHDLMNTFLDSYISFINRHRPSAKQAADLLLTFFNDTMRTTVNNKIKMIGLQETIEYLRKTKRMRKQLSAMKKKHSTGSLTDLKTSPIS